ncbi:unnamed protein product [Prorocentrum cordatum]|uniref:N-acetyltransferase domain-containing protein n=1 Tax=Prorocentrum cordatum TaxID=2364126 RepID=A0ABN9RVP7_9DINO|nr:unnamed protein product [Polarella glacialis]
MLRQARRSHRRGSIHAGTLFSMGTLSGRVRATLCGAALWLLLQRTPKRHCVLTPPAFGIHSGTPSATSSAGRAQPRRRGGLAAASRAPAVAAAAGPPRGGVALIPEWDAAELAAWLQEEDEGVQLAVDGGDFGRPISSPSISGWWASFRQLRNSAREVLRHQAFRVAARLEPGTAAAGASSAGSAAEVVGHVEVAVVRERGGAGGQSGGLFGPAPYGILLFLYVRPGARRRGVATAAVRQACEWGVGPEGGASKMVLLVDPDNAGARKLYADSGFRESRFRKEKMGKQFIVAVYEPREDEATAVTAMLD